MQKRLFLNILFETFYIFLYLLLTNSLGMPGLYGIAGTAYIGLFEMGISFVLWLKAMKYSENTSVVSNIIYLSPFLSLFFISIFVGEMIRITTIFGLVLIIGGILLQRFVKKRKY